MASSCAGVCAFCLSLLALVSSTFARSSTYRRACSTSLTYQTAQANPDLMFYANTTAISEHDCAEKCYQTEFCNSALFVRQPPICHFSYSWFECTRSSTESGSNGLIYCIHCRSEGTEGGKSIRAVTLDYVERLPPSDSPKMASKESQTWRRRPLAHLLSIQLVTSTTAFDDSIDNYNDNDNDNDLTPSRISANSTVSGRSSVKVATSKLTSASTRKVQKTAKTVKIAKTSLISSTAKSTPPTTTESGELELEEMAELLVQSLKNSKAKAADELAFESDFFIESITADEPVSEISTTGARLSEFPTRSRSITDRLTTTRPKTDRRKTTSQKTSRPTTDQSTVVVTDRPTVRSALIVRTNFSRVAPAIDRSALLNRSANELNAISHILAQIPEWVGGNDPPDSSTKSINTAVPTTSAIVVTQQPRLDVVTDEILPSPARFLGASRTISSRFTDKSVKPEVGFDLDQNINRIDRTVTDQQLISTQPLTTASPAVTTDLSIIRPVPNISNSNSSGFSSCSPYQKLPCARNFGRDCKMEQTPTGCEICICPFRSPARGCAGRQLSQAEREELLIGKKRCPNGRNVQRVIRYYRKIDPAGSFDDCVLSQEAYCGWEMDVSLWRMPRSRSECLYFCYNDEELARKAL